MLIAGDQVLPKISTNVGVWPNEPQADALTWFLDGFSRFRRLPADALVLPSHGFPFIGLHTRLDQLVAHHDARLNDMTAAIARHGGWRTARPTSVGYRCTRPYLLAVRTAVRRSPAPSLRYRFSLCLLTV